MKHKIQKNFNNYDSNSDINSKLKRKDPVCESSPNMEFNLTKTKIVLAYMN